MTQHIAIVGAGITGSCLALLLCRSGHKVDIFDQFANPFCGASRWNEGKIHLGHLYSGDPSGHTFNAMFKGALKFGPILESILGKPLSPVVTPGCDTYLCHRESIVSPEKMEQYFDKLDNRISNVNTTGYIASYRPHEKLSAKEAALLSNDLAHSGFRVSEHSVDTQWVADQLVEAIEGQTNLSFIGNSRIKEIRVTEDKKNRWFVLSEEKSMGPYDFVVNASWEGRPALDEKLGIKEPDGWSHRFRTSLFVTAPFRSDFDNRVLAVGPYGDVKNYGNGRYYLSWYTAGLLATGYEIFPPDISVDCISNSGNALRRELCRIFSDVDTLLATASEINVNGGWVFARGKGNLSDENATIHRRDKFGISRRGNYFSVDTGKYSVGPYLALQIAQQISERVTV